MEQRDTYTVTSLQGTPEAEDFPMVEVEDFPMVEVEDFPMGEEEDSPKEEEEDPPEEEDHCQALKHHNLQGSL